MVQHLQMWDYVSLSKTMEGRIIEYVDQQHEHFVHPCVVKNAKYVAPTVGFFLSNDIEKKFNFTHYFFILNLYRMLTGTLLRLNHF